mmetsp:Transcript_13354/g.16905  ORF Transcript_13354/g.16905 Transcript_13354/m.16905 type:complete len:312 (-) Transcript_13354:178-1113(-)
MLFEDAFDFTPLIQGRIADHQLAVVAQVLNLGLVWAAKGAEVVEVDIDDKIGWNDLSLVFANVFWAQLHLACLYVITSLNEGGVEHDAEHGFVRKACVPENDLHVAFEQQTSLLLLSQQEDHSVLFLAVLLLRRVGKGLADVQTATAVDLEEGHAAAAAHVWHLHELNAPEALGRRRLDLLSVEGFEVIEVPELAGLTHALAACEAHLSVKLQTLVHIFKEAHEEEHSADGGSRATFARVAVHDQDIFGVIFQPVVALASYLIEEGEGRAMVVRPVVVSHPPTEVPLRVVGRSLRSVDYVVLVAMFLSQER